MIFNVFFVLIVVQSSVTQFSGDPCVTKDGLDAICRPATQCRWFETNLKEGNIKHNDAVICGFSTGELYPDVCCPESEFSVKFNVGLNSHQKAELMCSEYEYHERVYLNNHISHGEPVSDKEFPHVAALGRKCPNEPYEFYCGASLISVKFLLTAAHCVSEDKNPVIARLGAVNVKKLGEGVQDVKIKKIIQHHSYNAITKHHDIALVELESPIKITDFVTPICLYTDGGDSDPPADMWGAGWGIVDVKRMTNSDDLLKVKLNYVVLKSCAKEYKEISPLPLPDGILSSMLCAKGDLKNLYYSDACNGDSGAPVQIETRFNGTRQLELVGITSFRYGCAANIPGVFTRVGSYIDWIVPKVWP